MSGVAVFGGEKAATTLLRQDAFTAPCLKVAGAPRCLGSDGCTAGRKGWLKMCLGQLLTAKLGPRPSWLPKVPVVGREGSWVSFSVVSCKWVRGGEGG